MGMQSYVKDVSVGFIRWLLNSLDPENKEIQVGVIHFNTSRTV